MFSACALAQAGASISAPTMSDLRIQIPAPVTACLECRQGLAVLGRALLAQRMLCETMAVYDRGQLLAVVYLYRKTARRQLFALSILPTARPHMIALIRLAQLTLDAFAQSGVVTVAQVHPLNPAGQRMCQLAGFRQGKRNREIWLYGQVARNWWGQLQRS